MRPSAVALLALVLVGSPVFGQTPDTPTAPAAEPTAPAADPTPKTATTTADGVVTPWAERERARLQAEANKLERVHAAQDADRSASEEATSLWPTFVRTVIMLTAVCLLAYLILGKALPKILQIEPPTAQRRLLKVVDRLAIDQKRSVMILQLGNEYFLVGAAEQNMTLMSKLDAEQIEQLLAEPEPSSPGMARWGELFVRRQAKGS